MRYFFGDECGSLSSTHDQWFVLGGYHITSREYARRVPTLWRAIRRKYDIGPGQEVKCSDLQEAYRRLSRGHLPRAAYLRHLDIGQVQGLTKAIIEGIQGLNTLRIVVAACQPRQAMAAPWIEGAKEAHWGRTGTAEKRCLGALLQNLMQRFEFDLRESDEEGTMFFDRLSAEHEACLEGFFNRLTADRIDHYVQYRRLVPSLSFQHTNAHHGLLVADHICHFCWGFLRGLTFHKRVLTLLKHKIRRGPHGQIPGYGFIFLGSMGVPESLFDDLALDD